MLSRVIQRHHSTRIEDGSNESLTLAIGHEILHGEIPYGI